MRASFFLLVCFGIVVSLVFPRQVVRALKEIFGPDQAVSREEAVQPAEDVPPAPPSSEPELPVSDPDPPPPAPPPWITGIMRPCPSSHPSQPPASSCSPPQRPPWRATGCCASLSGVSGPVP